MVVKTWVRRGLRDFYMAFYLSDKFPFYTAFFCHQGLEKICKAYLIGTMASDYEHLPKQNAVIEIDKIAKDKKKMGHNLKEMMNKLVSLNVLDNDILLNKYTRCGKKDVTGKEIVEILESAYLECRYPVPNPVHKKFPLSGKGKNTIYWSPIGSSDPEKFAKEIGLKIIKKVESDFKIKIPRDKLSSAIDDKDWIRFRRIFFKDNI